MDMENSRDNSNRLQSGDMPQLSRQPCAAYSTHKRLPFFDSHTVG
jgi:hypothetical protein